MHTQSSVKNQNGEYHLTLDTNRFFGSVLMSPIQMGLLSVNNSVTNITHLGTTNWSCVLPKKLIKCIVASNPVSLPLIVNSLQLLVRAVKGCRRKWCSGHQFPPALGSASLFMNQLSAKPLPGKHQLAASCFLQTSSSARHRQDPEDDQQPYDGF